MSYHDQGIKIFNYRCTKVDLSRAEHIDFTKIFSLIKLFPWEMKE